MGKRLPSFVLLTSSDISYFLTSLLPYCISSLMHPYFLPHAALLSPSCSSSLFLSHPAFILSHESLLPLTRSPTSSLMQPFFLHQANYLTPSYSLLPPSCSPNSSLKKPYFLSHAALLPLSCSPTSSLMQPYFLSHAVLFPFIFDRFFRGEGVPMVEFSVSRRILIIGMT